MRRVARSLALTAACALALPACGGGENAIIGVGNSGNRMFIEPLEEVAETLAELEVVDPVSDETIRRIYQAIADRALAGDSKAALVVLQVAERQRKAGG